MKILKYPLQADYDGVSAGWEPRQVIEMPKGARILSVALQAGKPVLWALVDPDAPKERRAIYVVNTGGIITEAISNSRFVGTFMFGDGGIVLHVFE